MNSSAFRNRIHGGTSDHGILSRTGARLSGPGGARATWNLGCDCVYLGIRGTSLGSTAEVSKEERLKRIARHLKRENERLDEQVRSLMDENDELRRMIEKNPVTALPIRRIFEKNLDVAMDKHHPGPLVAVASIRLDKGYDRIRHSRDKGHALLFRTAARIREVVGDSLYQSDRLDEFLILFPHMPNREGIELILERVVARISLPHEPPADDVSFSCHIGVASFPDPLDRREELVSAATIAMEEAERRGSRLMLYDEHMGEHWKMLQGLEEQLRRSVHEGFEDFAIQYQPFVDSNGLIKGSEALIRWKSAKLGSVRPDLFIPIAEENGDIRVIGQWIMYNAYKQLRAWHDAGHDGLYVSVNLAPSQFKQPDLVTRISRIIESVGLPGHFLKLELTERTVMEEPELAIRRMHSIRDLGVRISIDDFGTGYSSLNYLQQLPVEVLKIDKSFIEDLETNQNNQEIVKAIISLARSINIETLAEGVETKGQLDFLLREGCENIQGYYFSPPVNHEDFSQLLSGHLGGQLSEQYDEQVVMEDTAS